jgi:hypothetical protein
MTGYWRMFIRRLYSQQGDAPLRSRQCFYANCGSDDGGRIADPLGSGLRSCVEPQITSPLGVRIACSIRDPVSAAVESESSQLGEMNRI